MTQGRFRFISIQSFNDLQRRGGSSNQDTDFNKRCASLDNIKDIRQDLRKQSCSVIIQMIKHGLKWNEGKWICEDSEQIEMQVDEGSDHSRRLRSDEYDYYGLIHQSMLSRRKREKLTNRQR